MMSIVAAAAALLVGTAGGSPVLSYADFNRAIATRRALQMASGTLCSSVAQSVPDPINSVCEAEGQSLGSVEWDACCAFEADVVGQRCRQYVTEGQYCNPDATNCDNLADTDVLEISISFTDVDEDTRCCKTCTCYGDPECISFDGSQDAWIVCDARLSPKTCRMKKTVCESMMDPNGEKCKWLASKSDSRGWPIGLVGSPCQPDLTKEIRMNMYSSGSGSSKFNADLLLGERGIIQKLDITMGNKQFILDADKCFEEEGAASWEGDDIPTEWVSTRNDDNNGVTWLMFHEDSSTLISALCTRAISDGETGNPRINIQELTVPDEQDGEGFCASGSIDDKKGDNEGSLEKHASCVQNVADALQACKFLVNFGATPNELEQCAQQYCLVAQVDTNACIAKLKKGTENNAWVSAYCQAVVNSGQVSKNKYSACRAEVKDIGWDFATRQWGKGHKVVDPGEDTECATSISEYTLDKKTACDQGIYIEILEDDEWVPKYFIRAEKPPCDGKLTIPAKDAIDLFTHAIAFRQCDVLANDECLALGSCQSTIGATFSFEFINDGWSLQELLKEGVLRCAPDENGSETWCLPGAASYRPIDECVCGDPQSRPGRLLEGSNDDTPAK